MLRFRQLQALHTVINAGSVTKAAEALGISQPGVSNLISTLEHETGFPLFERIRGRLQPTPEAMQMYPEVDSLMQMLDQVSKSVSDIKVHSSGRLKIASLPALSYSFLPNTIADFTESHPLLSVSFQTRSSPKVQQWVSNKIFEVGIVEAPILHPNLNVEIISFSCLCAMHPGHRLAKKTSISASDLDSEPFIAMDERHQITGQTKDFFAASNAVLNVRFQSQLFGPACLFAARKLGIAFIDPFTAKQYEDKVVVRPLDTTIKLDLAIITSSEVPLSNAGKEFLEHLRHSMKSYSV